MKKRVFAAVLALTLLLAVLAGCAPKAPSTAGTGKLSIVATLFPQYDFARAIAGDKANITLLLPPGVESHTFEPTPADIVTIGKADLFIYTGDYMEGWAKGIVSGMQGSDVTVLDVSKNIELTKTADIESAHGDQPEASPEHVYDPHIWTDPLNAKIMVQNIASALCEIDPANAAYYTANVRSYSEKLDALDATFREIVQKGKRREMVFGGRFALYYFTKEYGLSYQSAYDTCSEETEPSAKAVADIIDEIRAKQIPVIYYEELSDPKVARSIAEETGAKLLLFHSCHNVSKDDLARGATYLSLMEQNAQNLKEGLS